MTIRDEVASKLIEEFLQGAAGWPTLALLRNLNDKEIETLHDVFLKNRVLWGAVSDKCLNGLPEHKKTALAQLQATITYKEQRELALFYREELDRRVRARQEKRMVLLTCVATVVAIVALIVALVSFILTH